MIKNIIMIIYNGTLNKHIEAVNDVVQYSCLYGSNESISYISLQFRVIVTDIIFGLVKSFTPKKWIKQ